MTAIEAQIAKNIKDYTEVAKAVADKIHDEYLFAVPANYDDDLLTVQLDKVVNAYEYLGFMVGILHDALNRIGAEADKLPSGDVNAITTI